MRQEPCVSITHLQTHARARSAVLSLFLPRISLLVLYLQGHSGNTFVIAPVPVLIALLVPRLLILFWIYTVQGLSVWFLVHAVALLMAWGGGGHQVYRRRSGDY